MTDKAALILKEDDLAWQNPPPPFIDWCEAAVRRALANAGFDLNRPITRIWDGDGSRWVQ